MFWLLKSITRVVLKNKIIIILALSSMYVLYCVLEYVFKFVFDLAYRRYRDYH